MLRLLSEDCCVKLDLSDAPEFDAWRWVDYWDPLREIVFFKRKVYELALRELEPLFLAEHQRAYKPAPPDRTAV
jgi:putative (di)nucleoside polyphosphate hydrolase